VSSHRLAAHLERLLEAGQAILLIDGLDEIPHAAPRSQFCELLATVADRFPDAPILLTSRIVGFQMIQEQLAPRFDHLIVGPLDRGAKQTFVERWGRLIQWPATVVQGLLWQVSCSRVTAKLTDNVFLLALVAQLHAMDEALPGRRVDVYRRAVEIMARRQRQVAGTPLDVNEVIPHLEFLAYSMRRKGVQRMTDVEATAVFCELRKQEPDEPVLATRDPQELLWMCVDSLGLLTVAGTETDERGYDRKLLQFFHQSFQEYFAGQAIKHGRGGVGEGTGAVAQIRAELSMLKVAQRDVTVFGQYMLTEPVLADNWQEVVRMLIADLPAGDADDAVLMLLPGPTTSLSEARARAVFALQCLADEPEIGHATVEAVFDAVIDSLSDGDGWNSAVNTWMDQALVAAGESRFGTALRDRMIADFVVARSERRNRIGCCVMLTKRTVVALTAETADTVIELTNCFFLTNGELGFLRAEQRARLLDALVASAETDEATAAAALWALVWLCDARNRVMAPRDSPFVALPSSLAQRIEAVMQRPNTDEYSVASGALALNREDGVVPVSSQCDWIYQLARIADGDIPRRALPAVAPTGRTRSVDWLLGRLSADRGTWAASRIAAALGAFGIFRPEMAPALRAMLFSTRFDDNARSEAAVYLAMISTPEAVDALREAADTPPEGKEDLLYSRGLFGLLYVDNVDVLAGQIRKSLPHSDSSAYAAGLAGSQDPRGKSVLQQFLQDSNSSISRAAQKALKNPKL
jgi:hypothetical protein